MYLFGLLLFHRAISALGRLLFGVPVHALIPERCPLLLAVIIGHQVLACTRQQQDFYDSPSASRAIKHHRIAISTLLLCLSASCCHSAATRMLYQQVCAGQDSENGIRMCHCLATA